MNQKGQDYIDLQTAAALIATFVKRGEGQFSVIDTSGDNILGNVFENGRENPKPFYEKINKYAEETHIYYKPYLTWAEKGKIPLFASTKTDFMNETYIYYKVIPSALKCVYIQMQCEVPEIICINLPSSIYAKVERQVEEWSKFGTDYDKDPVFITAGKYHPYNDNGQISYFNRGLQQNTDTQSKYWWDQQEQGLSDWRKNYMRTLELRAGTINAKRMLRVNLQQDLNKVKQQ